MSKLLDVLSVLCAAVFAASDGLEDRLISWGLAQHARELEPEPHGKRIEEVLIASEDIFSEGDIWPVGFNKVHMKTREEVVRREVLLAAGDVWDDALAIETERIMRTTTLWALVRVVPVKGTAGGIAVLVVTQDRWSLRLNGQYNLVGDLLQYFRQQPSEWNLFGFGKQVSLDVQLTLGSLTVSRGYVDPRLFGTRLRFAQTLGLVLNRNSGEPEGIVGSLALQRPLVALSDRLAWGFTFSGSTQPVRVFRGPTVWQLDSPYGPVPNEYRAAVAEGEGSVTGRIGTDYKLSLQGGVKGYGRRYSAPLRIGEEKGRWLEANYAPASESALGLVTRVEAFENRWAVVEGVESMGVSEDVQLGFRAWAGAFWAPQLPFTSARWLETALSLRYRWLFAGNLLTLQAAASVRFTFEGLPVNRRGAFEVVNVSPPIGGGRLAARIAGDLRQADLTNTRALLGGGNGLRGAPPELQAGRNWLLGNLEYRTRTWPIGSAQIGGAMFYDVGSAFDAVPTPTHTLGTGLRVLFPQFGPEPLRFDLGFVVGGPGFPGAMLSFGNVSSAYGQITDFRPGQFFDAPL